MSFLPVKTIQQPALERANERDRAFGLAVYSALILLANAFYRRFVGGEPRCRCQK